MSGSSGPAGAAGTQWYTSSGVPTNNDSLYNGGDQDLNTLNGDVYAFVAVSSSWTFTGLNLLGPAGVGGSNGVRVTGNFLTGTTGGGVIVTNTIGWNATNASIYY